MICGTAPPVFEPHAMALDLFTRLRGSGFNVGVGELLALHRALAGGWGTDDADALARVARLIWCNSRQEQAEFDLQWQALAAYWAEHHAPSPPKSGTPAPTYAAEREGKEGVTDDSLLPSRIQPERQAELAALPVRAPFISASVTGEESIQSYWPLSRRALLYAWRYLRRPVADGPADVLDVAATVAMTVQQGFYLAPVYRRRLRNHARLLLLVDQGGSMTPFHRFTRDLIETAQQESTLAAVELFYFHNIFEECLYRDPQRTVAEPLAVALAGCDAETSVLIVSDAGAARGRRSHKRIGLTARALAEVQSRTPLLGWLNPMPRSRWHGSSAEIIAGLVPMYTMSADDLSAAIDQLRGQG